MHRLSNVTWKTASLNYWYYASDLHMKIKIACCSTFSLWMSLGISIAPRREKLSVFFGSCPSSMFTTDASLNKLPWLDCKKVLESLNLLSPSSSVFYSFRSSWSSSLLLFIWFETARPCFLCNVYTDLWKISSSSKVFSETSSPLRLNLTS